MKTSDIKSILSFRVCNRSSTMPPVMMKKIMKVAKPMYPYISFTHCKSNSSCYLAHQLSRSCWLRVTHPILEQEHNNERHRRHDCNEHNGVDKRSSKLVSCSFIFLHTAAQSCLELRVRVFVVRCLELNRRSHRLPDDFCNHYATHSFFIVVRGLQQAH